MLFASPPVEGHGIAKAPGLEPLLSLEEHRDAGCRQQNAAARVERRACQPAGSPGLISWGRRLSLRRPRRRATRVDDALEGVLVVSARRSLPVCGGGTGLITRGYGGRPESSTGTPLPLAPEAGPALATVLRKPRIVLEILGDGEASGEALVDLAVQLLKEQPAFGDIRSPDRRGADVERGSRAARRRGIRPTTSAHCRARTGALPAGHSQAWCGPRACCPAVVVEVDARRGCCCASRRNATGRGGWGPGGCRRRPE